MMAFGRERFAPVVGLERLSPSVEAVMRKLEKADLLNVGGSAELGDMVKKLKTIFNVDAETLREDFDLADKVIDQADELAAKMEDYF